MVINTQSEQKDKGYQTKQTELLNEMKEQVPPELWSKHDTDVGFVRGIVHPGVGVVSSFAHPRVVPGLCGFLCSAGHRGGCFEEGL